VSTNGQTDKENMEYKHNKVLFSHEEEQNHVISGKWVKLEIIKLGQISILRKTDIVCFLSHAESR
jgi:hypothetical protein